jgi:hypothetical protein
MVMLQSPPILAVADGNVSLDIARRCEDVLHAIDFLQLKFVLERFELSVPVIATPREIVKTFLR